jgi:hypothetical protein
MYSGEPHPTVSSPVLPTVILEHYWIEVEHVSVAQMLYFLWVAWQAPEQERSADNDDGVALKGTLCQQSFAKGLYFGYERDRASASKAVEQAAQRIMKQSRFQISIGSHLSDKNWRFQTVVNPFTNYHTDHRSRSISFRLRPTLNPDKMLREPA